MKWYVAMLFLLVGLVWSVSAQQIDPKLVGTWETHDGPCSPCMLTIQPDGKVSFTQAGSDIQVVFSRGTPEPGIDLIFPLGGKADLKLMKSNALVGFYTNPNRPENQVLVAFQRK
jgi:hypothetical protein